MRKGVAAGVFPRLERARGVELELRRDGKTSVGARTQWTLFRHGRAWRPNPPIDDGHYTTLGAAVTFDTRNDRSDPTAGWLLRIRYENARSTDVVPQTGGPSAVRGPIPTHRP